MVALGFMYPEGYLRQRITADGWQINQDETLDRENASISRVCDVLSAINGGASITTR